MTNSLATLLSSSVAFYILNRLFNLSKCLSFRRATGYASAKVGRMAAFTIGGAIILIEIAHEQGVLKIDWSKVSKKVDQVGDKVQEAVTGEGPKWMEKVRSQAKYSLIFPRTCGLLNHNLSPPMTYMHTFLTNFYFCFFFLHLPTHRSIDKYKQKLFVCCLNNSGKRLINL